MRKDEIVKKLIGVLGLLVVLIAIGGAFVFRSRIEKFAMTGYLGVLIACFAATSTILLPAPGIFVVIQYAQFLNPALVILLGGIGTSLGEMIGYLLGRSGQEIVDFNADNKVFKWFRKKTYLTVFVFSLIPLPLFDVVGIAAGVNKVNPILFLIMCFSGKVLKMVAYVALYSYAKDLFLNFV